MTTFAKNYKNWRCETFRTTVDCSIYVAILQEHAIDCAGPILEVCEAGLTHYIAPLENNDKFFVPEVTDMEKEAKKEQ